MGLRRELLNGIYAFGYEKACTIQQKGIVPFIRGHDCILQTQSGTGKIATFCSGILQGIDYELHKCQALVLALTKDLPEEISFVMEKLGEYLHMKVHNCNHRLRFRNDVHVLVGAPGSVFHLLRTGKIKSDSIKMLVFVEADTLLAQGFKDRVISLFLPFILPRGFVSIDMVEKLDIYIEI